MYKKLRPDVILFNAISLDAQTIDFPADVGIYYQLAGFWKEDATLAGSDTLLMAGDAIPPETPDAFCPAIPDPADTRPVLIIPDSRGRIKSWHYLRSLPYWKDFISLGSAKTPGDHLRYLEERHIKKIITGKSKVDLRRALEILYKEYGIKKIRVDSGGVLNSVLLSQGLVDELSLLVHPFLVRPKKSKTFISRHQPGLSDILHLNLVHYEQLGNGLLWLRYRVPAFQPSRVRKNR
jgi:2,5-diamino-6-(ribosylamino)-4(3H)-pyrimidinone 5'-phosphate reductase